MVAARGAHLHQPGRDVVAGGPKADGSAAADRGDCALAACDLGLLLLARAVGQVVVVRVGVVAQFVAGVIGLFELSLMQGDVGVAADDKERGFDVVFVEQLEHALEADAVGRIALVAGHVVVEPVDVPVALEGIQVDGNAGVGGHD